MKIKFRIEKNDEVFEKNVSIMMIRSLYDSQFCIDEIDEHLNEIFKLCAEIIDIQDEGKCYRFKKGKITQQEQKFYHSGKKPVWKKVK